MLELHALSYEVSGCFGTPEALDRLAQHAELSVRVAPGELLLLGEHPQDSRLDGDPNGVVLDLTSGFAIWSLRGDDRFEAFRRLSAVELPNGGGVVQGLVAHLPAKVIARVAELIVMVSSVASHHLCDRVVVACADLAPADLPDGLVQEGAAI